MTKLKPVDYRIVSELMKNARMSERETAGQDAGHFPTHGFKKESVSRKGPD